MSTTLYEQAIADAKQLREMAEQNAKNQIIDAIAPRIAQLVEQQLMGGDAEMENPDADALETLLPDESEEEVSSDVAVLDLGSLIDDSGGPDTSVTVAPGSGVDIEIGEDGNVEIESPGVEVHIGSEAGEMIDIETGPEIEADTEEEDLLLSKESIRALVNLVHGSDEKKHAYKLSERAATLTHRLNRFNRLLEVSAGRRLSLSQRKLACKHYRNLLQEAISLRNDIILTEGAPRHVGLQKQINHIMKEIKKMSKRRDNQILKRLLETDEETKGKKEDLEELDAILTLEPTDDEEAATVEDLLADLEIDVELEEPIETVEVEDEEEVEVDVGEEAEEVEIEETYEIDEGMLRRELRRMRRLREQEESDAVDAGPADGGLGGDDEGDAFVDVDEDTLLNALADELGDSDVPSPTVESLRKRARRRAARSNKTNESRKARALQRKLVEYKKAVSSLRNQLIEMNLFNAKLLYANKLMQNRNVTSKQQRGIVEALDNAKTLREAKLLYKSLTTSLAKRSGKTLSEGRIAKTLGSSSRSTRSASPSNNGNEVDRWAVLAGLNKDN
jgi:hypothetical protein